MRFLKKSMAIVTAVAMMLSLMTFNVLATEEEPAIVLELVPSATEIGQGKSITVDLMAKSSADSLALGMGGFQMNFASDVWKVADATPAGSLYANPTVKDAYIKVSAVSGALTSTPLLVGKYTFTAKENATTGDTTISFQDVKIASADYSVSAYTNKAETVTIKILKAFTVATVEEVAAQTAELGAKVSDVKKALADLEFTVKGADEVDTATLKATDWTCADITTENIMEAKEYTFTGTLVGTEVVTVPDDKKTVTVKVNVGKITLTDEMVVTEVKDAGIKMVKDAAEPIGAADALLHEEVTAVLPTTATIAVEAGLFEEKNATIAWAVAEGSATNLDLTKVTSANVDNYVTIEGTVTPAEGSNYTGTAKITAKIVVVPAEVQGGFELKSTNINKAPEVVVTIPAGEFAADGTTTEEREVVDEDGNVVMETVIGEDGQPVMVQKEENGELVWETDENGDFVLDDNQEKIPVMVEKTQPKKEPVEVAVPSNEVVVTIGETPQTFTVGEADVTIDDMGTEDTADDTVEFTVEFEKKLKDMGYANGDDIVVTVKFNGADVVVGEEQAVDENGEPVWETDENGDYVLDENEEKIPVMVPVTSKTETAKKPVSGTTGGGVIKPSTGGSSTGGSSTGGSTGTTPVVPSDDHETLPPTEAPFNDVDASHWAAAAVAQLKEAGIVSGSGDGNFAPETDITRAEFTKMVVGLLGLEATSTEVAFTDCTAADWFTPYVAAAVEAGLVNGVSETEFAPNATITREQAFAIIGRAVVGVEANTTLTFADVADIDEYAVPYVTILVQSGIVEGYPDGTVRPDANITRAEAAKVIAGLMAMVVTEDETLPTTDEEAVEGEEAPADEAAEVEEAPADEAAEVEEAPADEATEGEEAPADEATEEEAAEEEK